MKLTLEEIAKAVEGRLIGDNAVVTAVSTDTRTISNGALFIPLKGASFDGHKFIDVAVENGAVAVISQEEINTTVPVIMVEDTHKALGDLVQILSFYFIKFLLLVLQEVQVKQQQRILWHLFLHRSTMF